MLTLDFRRALGECIDAGPPRAIVIDAEYLDLDGDGVPDAVRTARVTMCASSSHGVIDVIEVVEELAWGIDDWGAPRHVVVADPVEIDLNLPVVVEL